MLSQIGRFRLEKGDDMEEENLQNKKIQLEQEINILKIQTYDARDEYDKLQVRIPTLSQIVSDNVKRIDELKKELKKAEKEILLI